MIKKIAIGCTSFLLSIALVGCDPQGELNHEDVGALTGSVLGGVLGAQVHGHGRTAAIIGGTLLGGYMGGNVGRSMDDVDRMKLAHSLEYTQPHKSAHWVNEKHGKDVTVTMEDNYRHHGRLCRRFKTLVIIDHREQQAYGKACRRPNGQWQIIS